MKLTGYFLILSLIIFASIVDAQNATQRRPKQLITIQIEMLLDLLVAEE